MEKLSCIYLQKDEAGSSILTFGLQGDFKVSADADSRVKSIPIPYGNGPKGYFDYSGNQPGLSYSQQALVSVPAFGTQPRAYFYCNLLALLSGGNPFMISYKDGVGDVRHTESVFGGTSSDIYSFTACSIHHQYSWNLACYYQRSIIDPKIQTGC